MRNSKKPETHRGRLGEILRVLMRHRAQYGLTPDKLCSILEDLGPTFVKLGQIMSSRPDILPKEYCLRLESLRSNVAPLPFAEVLAAVSAELGRPASEVFSQIDERPLGSASVAQAHRARAADGRAVVLKIQRPNIREKMLADITLLKRAASVLKIVAGTGNAIDFNVFLDEMKSVTAEELSFLREAANLEAFAQTNAGVKFARCPKVFREFTTDRLLVMEYVEGYRIDNVEGLKAAGYDLREIAVKLADNYIKQITEDGFFHADPHAGNLIVSGDQIVWIDLGMMGRLSEEHRRLFREGIQAVLDHDCLRLKNILLSLGNFQNVDDAGLYQDIDRMLNKYGSMAMGSFDISVLMTELLELANGNNISLPSGMSMFARGILTVESVLTCLDPSLNIMELFQARAKEMYFRNFDWKGEIKKRSLDLYRVTDKIAELPSDLSQYLKMSIAGVARMNVELADARKYKRELSKFTVRIILAILCAALLISAALLAESGIWGTLWGLSVISFCELAAAGLAGLGILLSFLLRRKPRRLFRKNKRD